MAVIIGSIILSPYQVLGIVVVIQWWGLGEYQGLTVSLVCFPLSHCRLVIILFIFDYLLDLLDLFKYIQIHILGQKGFSS